jgi:hypothetical protein
MSAMKSKGRREKQVVRRQHECLLVNEATQRGIALLGSETARLHCDERVARCQIVADLLDKLRVVQCCAALLQRRCDRRAERARGDAREVEEPGRRRNALRQESRQRQRDERNEEHR